MVFFYFIEKVNHGILCISLLFQYMNNKYIALAAVVLLFSGCSLFGGNKGEEAPLEPYQPPPAEEDPVDQLPSELPTPSGSLQEQLQKQSQIKKFASLEEFEAFMEERSNEGMDFALRSESSMGMSMSMEGDLFGVSEAAAPSGLGGGHGAKDFSKTNVQVEGVDEADIIKTDGNRVYALVKNDVFVIDAFPATEMTILSKIAFKDRPENIYVQNNRLVVYGSDRSFRDTELYKSLDRWTDNTFFKVFDVTDGKSPKQLRDMVFEGRATHSRMIGDYVYFVTNKYNYRRGPGPILPYVVQDGAFISNDCSEAQNCFAPDIYYFDVPYRSYTFTSVSAINVSDAKAPITGDIYMLPWRVDLYASLNNIYLTYTKYLEEEEVVAQVMKEALWPELSEKHKDQITKIEAVENFILNSYEKASKVGMILEMHMAKVERESLEEKMKELEEKIRARFMELEDEIQQTVIHRIAIDKSSVEHAAIGEVRGRVLNQFAMDEKGQNFRIATTRDSSWNHLMDEEQNRSYNNMYVLDMDLNTVGRLENLAQDEEIYSVRFMGDRAYMVTFERIDPFFAIDLSNPTNPTVLGELKIPGFSNYLHPYDEDTIIGIGKETEINEYDRVVTKGLKVALFDVSDVSNPREVVSKEFGDGGSGSIALQDHKAFLFSKEKNLLVIPATLREKTGDRSWGKLVFSGAMVFDINKEGIELRGQIDHSEGGKPAKRDYWWGYSYYDNNVLRSLYLDDTLYTFSHKYLKANSLQELSEVNKLELVKEKETPDFEIVN